ncbi:SH2 domain-containing protein 7-like [Corythoichthys intestinalis]|uniref:SH2 domain-containing protein 7-like n=1 Tax=Corythoichthys intestinalis TaxID=161448 RepID=UPI0025A53A0B|nr:SH2 domain-containing protein 7-like [Corythoichthys intestinalis]
MASDSNRLHQKSVKKTRQERCCHFSWLKSLRERWRSGFKNSQNIELASQSFCQRKRVELSSKWFLETQLSHITQNGCIPTWFVGLVDREVAEDILKEKEQGCFLIRLSANAVGFVLSFRGSNCCRHFVINQSDMGHFVISGAAVEHETLFELIQYYKTSSIEPFGEYLTSSCFEGYAEKTYDVIQHLSPDKSMKKEERNSEQPPLPTMSKSMLEEVPPVPRRGKHHETKPPSDPSRMLYAQLRKKPTYQQHIRKDCSTGATARRLVGRTTQDENSRKCRPVSTPEYSLLGLVDHTNGQRPEKIDPCRRPQSSHSTEQLSDKTIYFLPDRPGSPHTSCKGTTMQTRHDLGNPVYTEANTGPFFPPDDIYEIIPGIDDTSELDIYCNTYESVEELNSLAAINGDRCPIHLNWEGCNDH